MSTHRGKMRKCVPCGKKFRTIAEVKLHQRDSLREERGLFEAVYDNEAYLHLRGSKNPGDKDAQQFAEAQANRNLGAL
jgi:hypothetical protein